MIIGPHAHVIAGSYAILRSYDHLVTVRPWSDRLSTSWPIRTLIFFVLYNRYNRNFISESIIRSDDCDIDHRIIRTHDHTIQDNFWHFSEHSAIQLAAMSATRRITLRIPLRICLTLSLTPRSICWSSNTCIRPRAYLVSKL